MTEAEMKAAEAWKLVAYVPTPLDTLTGREPMPAGAALDMVQDAAGGDRDDAVMALMDAAANWLAAKSPDDNLLNFQDEAVGLLSDIRSEHFECASAAATGIRLHASGTAQDVLSGLWNRVPDRPSVLALDHWRLWGHEADRVINLCRAVVAAAYPEEVR